MEQYQSAVKTITHRELQRGVQLWVLNGQSVIIDDAAGRHSMKLCRR